MGVCQSLSSATSRALTVDFILVNFIKESQKLSPGRQEEYLAIYDQVRDGGTISESDVATLTSLDSFIEKADISENAKVVYFLTRQQDSNTEVNFTEKVNALHFKINWTLLKAEEVQLYRKQLDC
jgi:hypothetical protein